MSDDLVESLRDEFIDLDKYSSESHPLVPGADAGGLQPVGLGPRVPMLIISPWTTGGWVCSQTFDHTSVLQFLEARFGVREPNITRWRRAICGDLTSAFDFSRAPEISTASFSVPKPIRSRHKPYHVPAEQQMPEQEPDTRPACPLPYEFTATCRVEDGKLWVDLINTGKAGAGFYAYNSCTPDAPPRRYAVSAAQTLSDYWEPSAAEPAYDLSFYGPNGYFTHFRARTPQASQPEASIRYDSQYGDISLVLTNHGTEPCTLTVSNRYASTGPRRHQLAPGATTEDRWVLAVSAGWFDLSVTNSADSIYLRRFAGHVETGRPSTSDPASYSA